jgi:signal peptidase I
VTSHDVDGAIVEVHGEAVVPPVELTAHNATARAALIRSNLWTGVQQLVVLISWAAVFLVLLLAAIAGLIAVTTGWDSVVVTSNSMSPTLRAGDVLFLAEHPDEPLGQQSVITFERSAGAGELVTHRIFETLADEQSYVTKGDANPTPDTDVVHQSQVVGVGRLVVPFLGLPILWMAEGNTAALAALAALALAALTAVVLSARHQPRRADDTDRFSSSAQRGISRVRLVVGLMIGMQLLVGGREFEFEAIGLTRFHTVTAAIVALAAISFIAGHRTRRAGTSVGRRLATLELAADTLVVVAFVAASGNSGIGWVLMALPIIEAAIHFRLTGAFIHWMVMGGLSVGAFLWKSTNSETPQSVIITDLEQLVDRLGVLLLVVIPASYLAEQLFGDVLTQRRATQRARERSRIIERVSDAGRDVTRLGGDPFETLVRATRDLGFDAVDVWAGNPKDGWRLLAEDRTAELALPSPGEPGSALRDQDLSVAEVAIDIDDPDSEAFAGLALTGAEELVRMTLTRRDEMYVVLRAAALHTSDDPTSQVMALRLLSGQAAVALQNEQLLSELKQTHDELEHQAMFDALTGLANRARFVGLLAESLRHDGDEHEGAVVLFLDLNGFKAVNDHLGHAAGDELLAGVAARLVSAVHGRGVVARLGGDEFTVLLDEGSEPLRADEYADAIHLALVQPFDISGEFVRVGASIGIAHSEPFITVSEMLRRADVAMYAAKGANGDWRTVTYRIELEENERRNERLAQDFDQALAERQFNLLYQPIVETVTGSIVGAEALIRWSHPELGAIAAPTIIEVAEETDNIDELNAWIFDTALNDIATCCRPCGVEPFVAVNVSPRELSLTSLSANMESALATSGISPSRVVVELSERIVAEARGSIRNVELLTEMGLALALDDFGEGQTSLAHLRGFPITYLKLDRLFIEHAGDSSTDRKILGSVAALAHDLGFSVIAEGIETTDHHTIVAEAGAELAQGFGLHKPMPIDDFRELLAVAVVAPFTEADGEDDSSVHGTSFPPPIPSAERVH